ncbi:MAG TPA: 30S ribosomal protein S17 [Candidatus Marinimicrobia bacterium]|jgi:small subunit ribosomal protein S17|nr:30S ribosomal protein S17 [Candidatus Neomarinimicrobiota bacterium]HIB27498.1 30S ribosomal protein S17 [Candidatus Neomarinimicrobiota bacterium]|tara:strand:+ start:320 stop:583 length:264 start_codon:yes stop_codon:yes gene_type:complete
MAGKNRQSMIGEVVSDKMEKTVVVQVTRKIPHPVYSKFVKRFKKYMVHVESVKPKMGDIVRIIPMRPMSKRKRWCVREIIRESVKIG